MAGGGEMGALIRSFNWAATPLGEPANWPSPLRQSVNMLLNTAFPILICWGTDYIQIYNDAFRPINGATKHPQALGDSARNTYAEIWDTIGPMFQGVMEGTPVGFPDFLVKLDRNGYLEDCYFDFSYSPVCDDDGKSCGIRVICVETTSKMQALKELDAVNHELASANEEMAATNEELASANEEMAATNEELASANEEMAATTEEITSTNEELAVINEELLQTQNMLSRTLDTLSESEQRFRNLVRDASVGIVLLLGHEMRVGIVNAAYARLLKRTAAELEGKLLFEMVPPEAENYFRPLIEGVRTTGEPVYLYDAPYLVYTNGEAVSGYLDVIYQPFREGDGIITGVIAFCQDVTAQVEAKQRLQQANEELTEKESRLKMAIAATNLGTWEYNLDNNDLYWSPECRAIYGIGPDEQPTMELFSEHIHPEDREFVEKEIARCIANGSKGRYDIIYRICRFDDNATRWIKVQGLIYGGGETPQRFIGTVLDISDRRQAEEQSAKLAAIITSSDDAIISKTLDSVITSWNAAAHQMFGYSADEMIGQTVHKLIPADRQDEENKIIERLRKGERVEHFETQRVTRDGRLIDVSLTISPIKDSEGRIIGASKIARDVTERKLDENRKNDFIGMVSHELKTPLTSLNAIIQVVSAKLKQNDDPFLTGAMERANTQVKKMTTMINGFLNVSRLESGKIIIERQRFDLYELIEEIVDETNLTVTTHQTILDQCDPIEIEADRDKIASVITNLINNAIKYSPNGKTVNVQCEKQQERVVVSVHDEGVGIQPNDLPHVFDRYFRSENKQTRHISGFGIGLYLSAEIIHRHNGDIWAESATGKGSTFYFSLPLNVDAPGQ